MTSQCLLGHRHQLPVKQIACACSTRAWLAARLAQSPASTLPAAAIKYPSNKSRTPIRLVTALRQACIDDRSGRSWPQPSITPQTNRAGLSVPSPTFGKDDAATRKPGPGHHHQIPIKQIPDACSTRAHPEVSLAQRPISSFPATTIKYPSNKSHAPDQPVPALRQG